MVVAHQRQHAAVFRGAGEIGVAEDVARAVDARPLAVPDAEHAVVLALAAQFGLLRAPQRGGGEVLVDGGLEQRVARGEVRRRALELVVEAAERRAAIAGDVARGVQAGALVALVLHQRQAHQRLIAGDEDAAFGQVVLVVEGDVIERHFADQCAPAGSGRPEGCEYEAEIERRRRASNAARRDRPVISSASGPPQRNVGAPGKKAFWRNAAKGRAARGPCGANRHRAGAASRQDARLRSRPTWGNAITRREKPSIPRWRLNGGRCRAAQRIAKNQAPAVIPHRPRVL